jgi:hypothetical protein
MNTVLKPLTGTSLAAVLDANCRDAASGQDPRGDIDGGVEVVRL